MEILKYFDCSEQDKITIYRLKAKQWKSFLESLPNDFRICFISNPELKDKSTKNGISKSEFLSKYIIPDRPNIKSGDFGEIFCYHIVKEHHNSKGFQLVGPRKWRWKDKNKPAQYSDIILFHLKNDNPESPDDFLLTVESKMKAVESDRHPIQDAINGASDDKLTRLSKSLIWLEEKYAKMGAVDKRNIVSRFSDPSKFGTYIKKHKAIATIDAAFEGNELSKGIVNSDGIKVIVFFVKNLKATYENTMVNIINSVTNDE